MSKPHKARQSLDRKEVQLRLRAVGYDYRYNRLTQTDEVRAVASDGDWEEITDPFAATLLDETNGLRDASGAFVEPLSMNLFEEKVMALQRDCATDGLESYLEGLRGKFPESEWPECESVLARAMFELFDIAPGYETAARYALALPMQAAVAMTFAPSSQPVNFPYVPAFIGERGGEGKSCLLEHLSPIRFAFNDSTTLHGRPEEIFEDLRSTLVWELGEGGGLTARTLPKFKRLTSASQVRFRPKFGRRTRNFPRRYMCFLTLNPEDALPTERKERGRRYLPVKLSAKHPDSDERTGQHIKDWLAANRDAIWAGALSRHLRGAPLTIADADIETIATTVQAQRYRNETVETLIERAWERLNNEYFVQLDIETAVNSQLSVSHTPIRHGQKLLSNTLLSLGCIKALKVSKRNGKTGWYWRVGPRHPRMRDGVFVAAESGENVVAMRS